MSLTSVLSRFPRHGAALENAVARAEASQGVASLLVVGSFASESADAVSDLDLIMLVADGGFDEAWHNRRELSTGALYRWDVGPRGRGGAHKWLTDDLVLVECLIGEPGAIRVAEPWIQVAGIHVAERIVPRDPISRAEVRSGDFATDNVERLYDALKLWVRGDQREARKLIAEMTTRGRDASG